MAVTNEAGNYTITPVTVGSYVIKAELAGFRTSTTAAYRARGEAGRAARLQDGRRGRRRDRRGHRRCADPSDRDDDRGRGPLGEYRAVASAQRSKHRPARAAPARDRTYNPRGFTNIGSVNMNRPFVNGNREQTNNFTVDGLDVNETIDNRVAYQPSPDALAEISVETNNYAADVGNVGGA